MLLFLSTFEASSILEAAKAVKKFVEPETKPP
jgi:hypothetical protein